MKDVLGRLTGEAKAGAVVGLLGFIVSISFTQAESFNGQVTSCSYFDVAALIFGSLALLLAAKCAMTGVRSPRYRKLDFVCAGALLVIGALHLVRAFGVVGGAC